MTISFGASMQQVINNLAGAERNIQTLQQRVQAPIYQPYNIGTVSSGTIELSAKNGFMQYVTNNGAHVLTPPIDNCFIYLDYTNSGSAGAVTTSGFTHVDGSFTTTTGDKFRCMISVINLISYMEIIALQ
jgi:hypothetical protein